MYTCVPLGHTARLGLIRSSLGEAWKHACFLYERHRRVVHADQTFCRSGYSKCLSYRGPPAVRPDDGVRCVSDLKHASGTRCNEGIRYSPYTAQDWVADADK